MSSTTVCLNVGIVAPRAGAAAGADPTAVVGPGDGHGLEAVEEGVVVEAVHLLVEGILRRRRTRCAAVDHIKS